jgi:hypothetical protein
MAILARMSAAGMDLSNYDQAGEGLTELVKKQPGFIIHVAYKTPDGVGVGEVWESLRDQTRSHRTPQPRTALAHTPVRRASAEGPKHATRLGRSAPTL